MPRNFCVSFIELALEKGIYPVPFAVAYDCIVPVVHPENSLTDIPMAQLRAIYMGEIKNWKVVGRPNKEIVVISRDTSPWCSLPWSLG
jgi:phosphate transport system substrate-binding protein